MPGFSDCQGRGFFTRPPKVPVAGFRSPVALCPADGRIDATAEHQPELQTQFRTSPRAPQCLLDAPAQRMYREPLIESLWPEGTPPPMPAAGTAAVGAPPWHALPATCIPLWQAAFAELAGWDAEQEFDFGLDALLQSILAVAPSPAGATASTR